MAPSQGAAGDPVPGDVSQSCHCSRWELLHEHGPAQALRRHPSKPELAALNLSHLLYGKCVSTVLIDRSNDQLLRLD